MRFILAFLLLLLLFLGWLFVADMLGVNAEDLRVAERTTGSLKEPLFVEESWISPERLRAIETRYGKAALERVQSWRQLIKANKSQAVPEKLAKTNEFFNRLRFENDSVHWGVTDYWATPFETVVTNGGDCEDLSVGKYFTLRELGISDECLRLTYVKVLALNKGHMVVTYQCSKDDEPLILDNIVSKIMTGSERNDLLPAYSFNASGLWLAKRQGMDKYLGDCGHLSMWIELLQRMNKAPAAAPQ